MSDTTKPALPEPLWAAVERYADEVAEYNAALRIDVGVDAAGKSCLAAEVEARDAIRAAIDAAVAEARTETEALKSDIADALTTIAVYEAEARAVPEAALRYLRDTAQTGTPNEQAVARTVMHLLSTTPSPAAQPISGEQP